MITNLQKQDQFAKSKGLNVQRYLSYPAFLVNCVGNGFGQNSVSVSVYLFFYNK